MYKSQKCVSGSVLDGNKECLSGLTFNTAKHPLTLTG
jgi:BRCT domain type II-containing protein